MRLLQVSGGDDPLPQFEGDGGDVVGTGDGRAVKGNQVWRLNNRPALRLQINDHQLLLYQDHQRSGISCGRRNRRGPDSTVLEITLNLQVSLSHSET